MPTATEFNIKWELFEPSQRQILENALQNGHYEQLAAVLFEVTPEQANEIEKIQRQMRPRAFKFDSQVQRDFEIWSTENYNDVTPENLAVWQEKMEVEKQEKLRLMSGGIVESTTGNSEGQAATVGMLTNELAKVKGLGEKSVKRLNAANIYSVDELRKLDHAKRVSILGTLVADKLKSLTL